MGKKLTVEVADMGIEMDKSLKLAGSMTNKNQSAQKLSSIMSLFQYGPRTGNVVYRPKFGRTFHQIYVRTAVPQF